MTHARDLSKPVTIIWWAWCCPYLNPRKKGGEKVCIRISGKGWCTRKDVNITWSLSKLQCVFIQLSVPICMVIISIFVALKHHILVLHTRRNITHGAYATRPRLPCLGRSLIKVLDEKKSSPFGCITRTKSNPSIRIF